MPAYPQLKASHLEAVCGVLGDLLTHSEINRLLRRAGIEDSSSGLNKRNRLLGALERRQEVDGCSNAVLAFIANALNPARYSGNPEGHARDLEAVNRAFVFAGYRVTAAGEIAFDRIARTVSEAEDRANRLGAELRRRGVHPEVLSFCRAELLADDYFHVLLESTKSVADLLRRKTGLNLDGYELVDASFGTQDRKQLPRLAINSLTTQTEKSIHWGLAALLKGTFSFYRNPAAHEPRVKRRVEEQEAMDMLTLVSFLYRQVELAVLIPSA
ncbi:MAG: TIGR02391 family protein [Thermoplasmata archaeon]